MSAQPSTSLVEMRDGFLSSSSLLQSLEQQLPVEAPCTLFTPFSISLSSRVFSTSTTLSSKYSSHAPQWRPTHANDWVKDLRRAAFNAAVADSNCAFTLAT